MYGLIILTAENDNRLVYTGPDLNECLRKARMIMGPNAREDMPIECRQHTSLLYTFTLANTLAAVLQIHRPINTYCL